MWTIENGLVLRGFWCCIYCDYIDFGMPLNGRTGEWASISMSNAWKWMVQLWEVECAWIGSFAHRFGDDIKITAWTFKCFSIDFSIHLFFFARFSFIPFCSGILFALPNNADMKMEAREKCEPESFVRWRRTKEKLSQQMKNFKINSFIMIICDESGVESRMHDIFIMGK